MKNIIDFEKLSAFAQENRNRYLNAKPYPHIIIDNALPESTLNTVLETFPKPDSEVWKKYKNQNEVKLETQGEGNLDEFTQTLLYQLNSAPFLKFLEQLTGIDNLIPDPYFLGGGLHQIVKGGKLRIHADFNRHEKLPLDRRLNVLIYLNKDWEENYGGHLELWNSDMTKMEEKILPIFNRMVIFSVTDYAYHGHPEPLNCPNDRTRKSIALYFFTNGRPEEEVVEKNRASTLFKARPGEEIKSSKEKLIHKAIRNITPPLLFNLIKKLR